MDICKEEDARFMAESLLSHAREICRYARAYCEPNAANLMIDEQQRAKFVCSVGRMVGEMGNLMLLAGRRGVSRFCNMEQIDAYMDEARRIVAVPAAVRQSAPLNN